MSLRIIFIKYKCILNERKTRREHTSLSLYPTVVLTIMGQFTSFYLTLPSFESIIHASF